MGRVRTLVACLATVMSAAACGGTEALTAPDAARFDEGGTLGSGNATAGPGMGSGNIVSLGGGPVDSGYDAAPFGGSGSVVSPGGQGGPGVDVNSD